MNKMQELGRMGGIKRWHCYNLEIQNFLNNNKLLETHSKELAALCGFIAGDGSMDNRPTHYEIRFYPDDLKLAKIFKRVFHEIYGKKLSINKNLNLYGNCYYLRVNSKKAYKHLISLSTFGTMDWKIPEFVLKNNALMIEWLKAYFDCEAYVNPNGKVIQVQSVNKTGLYQVKEMLDSLGIKSKIYEYERKNKNWNTNYILCIMGKTNIKNFHDIIGSDHSKKSKTLKKIIKGAGLAEPG